MILPDVLQDPFTAKFLAIALAVLGIVIWHFFSQRTPQNPGPADTNNPVAASGCSRTPAVEPAVSGPLGTSPLSRAAHSLFSSYPTISICCDTLFSESDIDVLSDGISMPSDIVLILREASNTSKIYLIYQDTSLDGMLGIILNSALEAEGLLGTGKCQVPKHRLVCCNSVVGKIAIVRQLETSLHIESNTHVHGELARFKTLQWPVGRPNTSNGLVAEVRRRSGI